MGFALPNQTDNSHYVARIPVEDPPKNPGRIEGVFAIACAIVALIFFPPIFGLTGVVMGIQAQKKGKQKLGVAAVILSVILMICGIFLSLLASYFDDSSLKLTGVVFKIF